MEKQYLTEEKYQKANNKVKLAALLVFIFGLLAGGALIAFGVINQIETDRQNQATVAAANIRLGEIKQKIAALETEEAAKNEECNSMNMFDSDWFQNVTKCEQEESSISSQISDLEMEQFDLEHLALKNSDMSAPLYIFGAFLIIGGSMVSLMIWLFTKRRAIRAYGAQQTLPVNKEIIDEYSGTVADAAGKIASAVKQSPDNAQKTDDK